MMRKMLLLVMLAMGYVASAQEKIYSHALEVARNKKESGDWKWDKRQSCDAIFTLKGDTISINDDHSVYVTYKTVSANSTEALWLARDQDNKDCTVKIEYGVNDNYITISYYNLSYRYIFNE